MNSKDAYIAQMKLQLHELHARMAELEVKAWLAREMRSTNIADATRQRARCCTGNLLSTNASGSTPPA